MTPALLLTAFWFTVISAYLVWQFATNALGTTEAAVEAMPVSAHRVPRTAATTPAAPTARKAGWSDGSTIYCPAPAVR
jgi:hypothetical protein